MATNMAEVTIKANYEITETSKALLRSLILEILHEDLDAGGIIAPFVSTADLKAYVAKEVRKALADILSEVRTNLPRHEHEAVAPPRAGLPSWARHEEGVGTQELRA